MDNRIRVGPEQDGQRLDNFLMAKLRGLPRARVYRMIRSGEVRVNKGRVRPQRRLADGDEVRLPPWAATPPKSPPVGRDFRWLDERIVYEDADLLVLDKPAGLAVHGGSGVSLGLIEALRAHRPGERFLELAHRLDRETSGLILVARRRRALLDLHERLRGRGVKKYYLALVAGGWPASCRQVDAPLRRSVLRSGERIVRVDESGQAASTRFRVLETGGLGEAACTLLRASPLTGRTHQIRVHCWHMGAPIVGDAKYGGERSMAAARTLGLARMALHASELVLPGWQGGEDLSFRSPEPPEWRAALENPTK